MSPTMFRGVIDIGNSGLKVAMTDSSGSLIPTSLRQLYWRYPSDQAKPPPRVWLEKGDRWASITDVTTIAAVLADCRTHVGNEWPITWWISSVQPQALQSVEQAIHVNASSDAMRVIQPSMIPMRCNVDNPAQVGLDRLLAAFGSNRLLPEPGPRIVIQAGTAITVDWVDAEGTFQGGAILPGLSLTLKYLALGTAHLPWLPPSSDPTHIELPGKNTRDAIMAGVNASFLGGIQLLISKYSEKYGVGGQKIHVILSGGDGQALSKALKMPIHAIDYLVLKSIAILPSA